MGKCIDLNNLSEETKAQLTLIEDSKSYVFIILIGIVLSYFALDIQQKQVICAATEQDCSCLPDVFPIKMTSSSLVMVALLFFFNVTKNNLNTPSANCADKNSKQVNYLASGAVLAASLIRYLDIINLKRSNEKVKATLCKKIASSINKSANFVIKII